MNKGITLSTLTSILLFSACGGGNTNPPKEVNTAPVTFTDVNETLSSAGYTVEKVGDNIGTDLDESGRPRNLNMVSDVSNESRDSIYSALIIISPEGDKVLASLNNPSIEESEGADDKGHPIYTQYDASAEYLNPQIVNLPIVNFGPGEDMLKDVQDAIVNAHNNISLGNNLGLESFEQGASFSVIIPMNKGADAPEFSGVRLQDMSVEDPNDANAFVEVPTLNLETVDHGVKISGTLPNDISGNYKVVLDTDYAGANPEFYGHIPVQDEFTITVPGNIAPTAGNISKNTSEDHSVSIPLNGADADGDTLTYSIVSQPSHGSYNVSTGVYTPSSNYNGSDSFTYRVNDGQINSNTATVSVNISAVNDAASLSGDFSGSVSEDGTLTDSGNVSVSDIDSPENLQTGNFSGNYGTFVVSTGGWTYNLNNSNASVQALNTGQSLTDTITVRSADGTATRTVSVTIDGVTDVAPDIPTDFSGVSYTVVAGPGGDFVRPTGTVDTKDGDIIEYMIVNGDQIAGTSANPHNSQTYTFNGGQDFQGTTMDVQVKLQGKPNLEQIPVF